jgi:hypothetical protein
LQIDKSQARFAFTVPEVHINSTAKLTSKYCGDFTSYDEYSIPLYLGITGQFSSHGFNTYVFSEIKERRTGSIVGTTHYIRLKNLHKIMPGCILSVKKDIFTGNAKNMENLAFIGGKLNVDYLIIPCFVQFATHCNKGMSFILVLSCWNVKTGELLFLLLATESVTDAFLNYSAQDVYYNVFYDKSPPQYRAVVDKIVAQLDAYGRQQVPPADFYHMKSGKTSSQIFFILILIEVPSCWTISIESP